ncbi:MAG: hypothetical protein AAFV25_23145 [Bacteroidota bacterium]
MKSNAHARLDPQQQLPVDAEVVLEVGTWEAIVGKVKKVVDLRGNQ